MKRIICIFMSLCLAFCFVGCQNSDKEIKVSYDLKAEPQNLDPQTASDVASLLVIYNIFEGLMQLDDNGKAVPAAAENYSVSDDGKLYTFTLRDDLKWENDTNVTAYDFEFAFKRLLSKDTNSPNAKKFYSIKNAQQVHENEAGNLGVRATSDSSLEIELNKPNDNFLSLLTTVGSMPCNETFFTETFGKYGLEKETILANGAFNVSKWNHDEVMSLKKNNYYRTANDIYVSAVSLWINTDKRQNDKSIYHSAADRLLEEKVLSADVDGFSMEQINSDKFTANPFEDSTYAMVFNQNNPYLKNLNLRLAIATAFDRSSYKDVLHSSLSSAYALIPHYIMSGDTTYRKFAGEQLTPAFNQSKAFELYRDALSELDVSAVVNLKMIAPVSPENPTSNYFPFPSQILQKVLGIFIGIEESEDYSQKLKNGDFDIALVRLHSTDGTGHSLLNTFHSKNNSWGINNADLDLALDEVLTTSDTNLSDKRLADAEKIIVNQAIAIPVFYKTNYFVTGSKVENFKKNPYNGLIDFKQIVPS